MKLMKEFLSEFKILKVIIYKVRSRVSEPVTALSNPYSFEEVKEQNEVIPG